MHKTAGIVGIVVLAVALAGAYYGIRQSERTVPAPTEQDAGSGNASVGATGASSVIAYTDTGFSPTPLTVAVGTTVTWVNQSAHRMWVEATEGAGSCADSSQAGLNECQAVGAGGSYSYTFAGPGSFSYVNHESAGDTGIIMVTNASQAGPINPNAVPE